tara:strand:- start:64 stop:909 length:846 start_codon:yes stop_codon:yes gene_type:complete
MHIVFCADGNFLKPLELAVFSLLRTQKEPFTLHILMLDDFSTQNLYKLANEYNCDLKLYSFSTDLSEKGRFSRAMYGRLFIPALLSSNVEKVIYLDCDVMVKKDLADLWLTKLDDHPIGAVAELNSPIKNYLLKKFQLDNYFNSGVLLLDLNRLRREKQFDRTLELLHANHDLIYPDQDAMNVVFRASWHELPIDFNYMSLEKSTDASIVHYALAKPWNSRDNLNADDYYQLLDIYPLPLPSFYQDKANKFSLVQSLKSTFLGRALRHVYWNYLKPIRKIT